MDPATLLLITQILGLAAQAAASIPAIKQAFTGPTVGTSTEEQAQATANLGDAQANLALVVKHAQAALNPTATPVA
jgi:hypothetical protein